MPVVPWYSQDISIKYARLPIGQLSEAQEAWNNYIIFYELVKMCKTFKLKLEHLFLSYTIIRKIAF